MDRREFVVRGVGVLAVAGVWACGGDDGTGPDGDGDGGGGGNGEFDGTIDLTSSLRFQPGEVTIQEGDTVTWENAADIFHTITPEGHEEWDRREMSSTGETFEHTFNNAGTFDYFCEPHEGQGMVGTIIVESTM